MEELLPPAKKARVVRRDGYVNLLNKYGTSQDHSTAYSFTSDPVTPDRLLTEQYESNGLFARIIDLPAEEAVRHGFHLELNSPETENFVTDTLDVLNWEEKAATAIKWARLYGGSLMVFLTDDGGGLEEPLDPNRVRRIEELYVYERAVAHPVWDGFSDEPEAYQVSGFRGSFTVHKSRCLIFRNGVLPDQTAQAYYRNWGTPEYARIQKELRETVTSHSLGVKMLERSVQAVYSMKNLAQLLATDDGENQVLKRLQVIDMGRGIFNSIAIDSEGESYEFKSMPLSGVKDVMDASCNMLSAVTNIPQTLLFGRSPAGESATGASDLENYYNYIERIQRLMLRKNLKKLTDLIIQCGISSGSLDMTKKPDYRILFNPLWNMSEAEQAAIEQTKAAAALTRAQTAQMYVDMGAMDPSEIRKGLAQDQLFNIEELLDDLDEDELWNINNASGNPSSENPSSPAERDENFSLPFRQQYGDGGAGSGNFGHEGRPGQIGGSSEGGGSGSEAEKDSRFKNLSAKAQKVYDRCRENEKKITPVMNEIAADVGGEMYGLEYSVKTASSLERKVQKKMQEKGYTEENAMKVMGDVVRYTQMVSHDKIADSCQKTIDKLREKGYNISGLENTWISDRAYKGINIDVISPEGQKFELQIHSKESMEVKNACHILYEKQRQYPKTSVEYKHLEEQMKEISNKIPIPSGIDAIKTFKGDK